MLIVVQCLYSFPSFMELRPDDAPPHRLFLKPASAGSVTPECWYTSQVVGKNRIDGYAAEICSAAGIECRTNQFGRRTLVCRMHGAGFSIEEIMLFTGHTTPSSVKAYLDISDDFLFRKTAAAQRLPNASSEYKRVDRHSKRRKVDYSQEDGAVLEEEEEEISSQEEVKMITAPAQSGFVFNNCQVTINNYN